MFEAWMTPEGIYCREDEDTVYLFTGTREVSVPKETWLKFIIVAWTHKNDPVLNVFYNKLSVITETIPILHEKRRNVQVRLYYKEWDKPLYMWYSTWWLLISSFAIKKKV